MSAIPHAMGDPVALDHAVDQYAATARALTAAAEEMELALREGFGAAMHELRLRSARTSRGLRGAESRYGAATASLRDYAVELHAFHAATGRAQADYEDGLASQARARARVHEAHVRVREASMSPDQPHLVEEARTELSLANAAVDAAEDAMSAAHRAYARAEEALGSAAEIARARMAGGFDATEDGLFDYVREAWDTAVSVCGAVEQWAKEFFAQVMGVIAEAVDLFVAAVRFVLAVTAAIVVFAVSRALAAIATLGMISLIVSILQALASITLAGFAAYALAEILGVDGVWRLRLVVAAVGIACPVLGLFIVSHIATEATKPTPQVRPLSPGDIDEAKATQTLEELDAWQPRDAGDILAMGGMVDGVGGDARAVVDIARVVGMDGRTRWIVSLPSTKDWDLPFDLGAPNDLDADLMLMLFPELRTQYERGVLEAMRQAGIGSSDEVLLTGWSLGGIMAGSLIESGAGGYRYAGLICAGSPIDGMTIAGDVNVLQVKHTTDPVHMFDLEPFDDGEAGHVELWGGPGSGDVSGGFKWGNLVGHHNGNYVDTLDDYLSYYGEDPDFSDPFDDFLMGEGAVSITHEQYAFSE